MKNFLSIVVAWLLSVSAAFAAVNVNTATKEQLDSLKGIGPTKAQAIIDYRTKNGPFKSIDDLEKVPGIGPATLKEIRGEVSLTGATSVQAAEPKKEATKTKADSKGADAKGAAKSEPKKDAGKSEEKAAAKSNDAKTSAKSDDKKATPKAEDKKATPKAEDKKAGTKSDDKKAAPKDDAKKSAEKEGKSAKDEKK